MSAQKGFSPVIIIALVAIISLTALVIFFFQKSTRSNPTPSKTQSETKVGDSTDISFEVSDKKLLLTGGFADPSVIKRNNQYILYVNKFGDGGSSNLIYTSGDGLSWNETGKKVPGGPTTRAYLDGNIVRLYHPTQTPINPSDPPSQILSSKSDDGLIFTKEEGIRMKPASNYTIEGPSIIKLADGKYRMYFSEFKAESIQERRGARIMGATSIDGLSFTRDEKPSLESDSLVEKSPADWPQALRPFVLKRPAGGYIMFYNTHSKIFAAYSDDGISWKKLGGLGIKGADVDGFYLPDGKLRIYFGDFSKETSGVVYTAILKEVKGKMKTDVIDEILPESEVQPLGDNKPPPPPDCVGKKADDPNLSQSCQMWFKIK